MSDFFIHFLLGLVVSFAGSLPPGMISITVMDTAVRKSFRDSVIVAASASFIEFFQSFIAVLFSRLFMKNEMVSVFIQYGAAPLFLLLGIFFLTKDRLLPQKETTRRHAATNVALGFMVGALNVFVIPFWIFWTSYFASNKWINLKMSSIAVFSAGITVGTMLALMIYAGIGLKLSGRTTIMSYWGNKTLGLVLIAFAIYHIVRLLK